MADEPNFVDLFALTKVTPDAVVERFGSTINSSFFDASNILGGLKIKGLIDFTTLFGNQNSITVTDLGKQLLDEAAKKAMEPFDQLDLAVVMQLTKGGRSPSDLAAALNLKPKDLALRLFKLQSQGYISAELRNGIMGISLTEKGFMQSKTGLVVPGGQAAPASATPAPEPPPQPQPEQAPPKRLHSAAIILVIIIIIMVALAVLWNMGVVKL